MPTLRRALLALGLVAGMLTFAVVPAHADETVVHVVQAGDNLYRIGLKYGVAWTTIRDANGLATTWIYVGQRLVIPTAGTPETEPEPAPSDALPPPTTSHYTVIRGDTLQAVAARFGTTVGALINANRISNPNLIYVGQVLVLPGVTDTPEPTPPVGSSKSIVVDISQQRLVAYEGERLVFSFLASTGLPGQDTQPGTYSVLNKIPNAYGGNWNIWMPNWLGIYWAGRLQNGIHALPILSNGSRLWEGFLGRPISYGCVVLGVSESQQLYDWAEVGTPVIINY